jgi:lantibiotic transport system ATP-binding protein
MKMENILTANDLTKKYKSDAVVNRINLQIPRGAVYGFLGPNGAGKTTTIRMLLGLIKPSHGSISVFGKDLRKNRIEALKEIGALVENPSYYGHLNASENLEVYRVLRKAPKSKIKEVLEIVGLEKAAKKKVKEYSLGMKQRLGIAIALLGDPKLLILDEPTNGLDPQGILEIRTLIKSLAKERGITIIVSSHLLSEIDQMATYVGIISKGRLIFQDRIEELRRFASASVSFTTSSPEETFKHIVSYGIQAYREEEKIMVEAEDEAIAQVISLLVRHGISIYRVEENKKSLEDIFLDLIKEEGTNVQSTFKSRIS